MPSDTPLNVPRLHPFTLGDWLVEPKACRVSRGDIVVKLRPQLADLLLCLARHAGEIALKDEILAEVWPGQYIAESGLSRCVAELRQILQDDAQQPRFIETFPKRGYRLIAPVVWLDREPQEGAAPKEAPPGPDPAARTPDIGTPPPEVEEPDGKARRTVGRRWILLAIVLVLLAAAIIAIAVLAHTPASVLTERDPVLLAFENRTGDAVFDETIPLALSIQLEQSPYLGLLSPERVHEVLRMMKRPPETLLTREVGLEVCERVGGRALIVTSISRLGPQYVIGLEAVACGTSAVLARQQATTVRKQDVLGALQRAAGQIRLAVGESPASLERYNVPIVEATTASLEALRAVRRGDMAKERGQVDLALGFYRDAVSLDPDFALAYSRLGTVTSAEAEGFSAFEKAYALRQRVTVPERLEIEASYHKYVTGERAKVVEALELLRRSYPRRAMVRRGLVDEYTQSGRYDAALAEALQALGVEPKSTMNLVAVARAHLYLNQLVEARHAAEAAIANGGATPRIHIILFQCALAANDEALLARERGWAAGHPEAAGSWLDVEAEESVNRGRLGDAIDQLQQIERLADTSGAPEGAAMYRLRIARYEALCGLGARAMQRVDAELAHNIGPDRTIDAVKVAISAGAFGRAESLLDQLERRGRPGASEPGATLARAYRAAIAASRGRAKQAIELLAPLQPFELGLAYGFIPLFERAHAHYLVGDWPKARLAYETILAHSTVDSGRKLLPFAELGLARTLARAGDVAGSRRTYDQFFERWRQADPDLPVLLEARREYAALPK
ncbi:MAG TPA: winged helix-turn-helix domain-containing protein [Vicinamibacterales bacterium]|jgi:DNA-binding winged helix-turn-helix (wHTH) protein/tetratricopeptide (TPR) repeat protein